MSVRLSVGDAVLVKLGDDSQGIGCIKYIGGIHGCDMTTEYVGIELVEAINRGHNGTIDGYTYFSSPKGYGFHTKITNVVRKVLPSELVTQIREMLSSFTREMAEKKKLINKLSGDGVRCIHIFYVQTVFETETGIDVQGQPHLKRFV